MKLHKSFRMALNMVLNSRLRSWLTILGIVIGVASVIAIVGIGNGLTEEMNSQMGDLASDIITVTPGYSKATFGPPRGGGESTSSTDILNNKDIQALKGISGIDVISPKISDTVDIYYLGDEGSVSLTGVDQKVYKDITTSDILEGRMLDSADSNVILIGEKLSTEYFEDEILDVGKSLTVEGKSFRIVGIIEDGGRNIIMPINSAYDILDDKEKFEYDSIEVKIENADDLEIVEAEITKELMRKRHVDSETQDFTVSTNEAFNEMRSEMMSTLTTFLTAIASVSLLVGAVGIANTMFTSVLEKTKEIGIMKAIGARNNDILIIFVLNAGLIGLVGGIIGLVLGYLISYALTLLGMPTSIDLVTVFGTITISIGIGMISGIIPAFQASKLSPVDALRTD